MLLAIALNQKSGLSPVIHKHVGKHGTDSCRDRTELLVISEGKIYNIRIRMIIDFLSHQFSGKRIWQYGEERCGTNPIFSG